jgi:RRXRR protein
MFVPVVDHNQQPLMPTTPARARRWIKSGQATPFWKGGIFCIRLNREPPMREVQPIAVGIDPGSKKEGYSVRSVAHTYLNIQADARAGVKDSVKQRRRMRRARRQRTTPCRQPRQNRKRADKKLPPSTRARGPWKLRLACFLCHLFPVSVFVVEDIKACTTGKRRWDRSFSPLEVGKPWFYSELGKLTRVQTKQGYETKALREQLGLKKSSKKMAQVWEAHCVDAWVLAYSALPGHQTPDNTQLLCITALAWHHRQLHRLEPEKGGKRGTLVNHPKYGKAYIGGTMDGKLSLHAPDTGKRLTQTAQLTDCQPIKLLRWRAAFPPAPRTGWVSMPHFYDEP